MTGLVVCVRGEQPLRTDGDLRNLNEARAEDEDLEKKTF
jgi:hypothetical protein